MTHKKVREVRDGFPRQDWMKATGTMLSIVAREMEG